MTTDADRSDDVYSLLADLTDRTGGPFLLAEPGLAHRCPRDGVYLFFEPGETRPNGQPRVVRVGTHALTTTSRATLWGRLRQHRGSLGGTRPGGGNHRGSVFRHHVGTAILHRQRNENVLASWKAPTPGPGLAGAELDLEQDVSRRIGAMPVLWVTVRTKQDGTSDRGLVERYLIATLSTSSSSLEFASPTWLGNDADSGRVRASSLWNSNHVDEQPDPSVLPLLAEYVAST